MPTRAHYCEVIVVDKEQHYSTGGQTNPSSFLPLAITGQKQAPNQPIIDTVIIKPINGPQYNITGRPGLPPSQPIIDPNQCSRMPENSTSITNGRFTIAWNGKPNEPVCIFSAVIRYKTRYEHIPENIHIYDCSTIIADNYARHLPITNSCQNITADYWKQQSNYDQMLLKEVLSDQYGLYRNSKSTIYQDKTETVRDKNNWWWAITTNPNINNNDFLTIIPTINPPPEVNNRQLITEEVELFLLMHRVTQNQIRSFDHEYQNNNQTKCQLGTGSVGTHIIINYDYINPVGRQKRLTINYPIDKIKESVCSARFSTTQIPIYWWNQTQIGNGIRGDEATWHSIKFNIDKTDGTGLDQLSSPITTCPNSTINLQSNSIIKLPKLNGMIRVNNNIAPTIQNTVVAVGTAINEQQTIDLKSPTGGTWTIKATRDNTYGIVTLPWNANAELVQNRLETLSQIGPGNVSVTGMGTYLDPFVVTFIGLHAGRDQQPLEIDGSQLEGVATVTITTTNEGTRNERQTITRKKTSSTTFRLYYGANGTIIMPNNVTAANMKAALESIVTIGSNNVNVTKIDSSNATDDWVSKWHIDFIGTLSNINVPLITTTNVGFSVGVDWQGGVGINERQEITVEASGGVFYLSADAFEPTGITHGQYLTPPIPWNATAATIKTVLDTLPQLQNAATVTMTHTSATSNKWVVEFGGIMGKRNWPQLYAYSALKGTQITPTTIINGSGTSTVHKITYTNVTAGRFKLVVGTMTSINMTNYIRWNADAQEVKNALSSLIGENNVQVVKATDQNISNGFIITYDQRLGNVPLLTIINELGNYSDANPEPPYQHELTIEENTQPLLSKSPNNCCDQTELRGMVVDRLKITRNLMSPSQTTTTCSNPCKNHVKTPFIKKVLTWRQVMLMYGADPNTHKAYLYSNNELMPLTSLNDDVANRKTVVYISNNVNVSLKQIAKQLGVSKLLPNRM